MHNYSSYFKSCTCWTMTDLSTNSGLTIFTQNLSLLFQVCIQFITVKILYSIVVPIPGYIKDSETLERFKGKIWKWKPINCPCWIYKKYIPNIGFINQTAFSIFAYNLVVIVAAVFQIVTRSIPYWGNS